MRHYTTSVITVACALLLAAPSPVAAQEEAEPGRAYWAAMRSDLRNLVVAQEAFYAHNSDYARSVRHMNETEARVVYTPSPGVTVVVLTSSKASWSGIAIHEGAPGYVCAIRVGDTPSPLQDDAPEGSPRCKDPQGEPYPAR